MFTFILIKVRKTTKTRKGYNQVQHLTQNTTRESNKNTINITITNKSQEVSLFPADDHKAAIDRRYVKPWETQDTIHK